MKNELVFNTLEEAWAVAKVLMDNNYIVMLSKENLMIILNYEWSPCGDRNYIVFGSVDDYVETKDYDDVIQRTNDDFARKYSNIEKMDDIITNLPIDCSEWFNLMDNGYSDCVQIYEKVTSLFLFLLNDYSERVFNRG